MYRFLMVDDEEIVRRGFETRIDWGKAGFEFLPPCENGRDAIEAIEELAPDVVMTDIHMPHADGITVAAYAAERHPGIVVVILSGYDEFGYAQAAIRTKVFDYVLKPVSSRDLSALLAKIKAKLDADRRAVADEAALKERADRSGGLLRERSLLEFLSGSTPAPAARDFESLNGFDPSRYACAALVAEALEQRGDAVPEPGRENRLGARLGAARKAILLEPADGSAVVLAFDLDVEKAARAAAAIAAELLAASREAGAPAPRAGVGRAYAAWTDAPRSYAEARAALAYGLVRPPAGPYLYVQAAVDDPEAVAALKARAERLALALRTGAAERVGELARAWIAALDGAGLSPQRVRHEVEALFARAADELAAAGVPPAAIAAGHGGDFYGYVHALASPPEIEAALGRLASIAASTLEERGLHEPEWKVLDFKELVARRYADKDFSVGKAAERLSISESYLSKLVRRRLGRSFVDYLTDYRIERAKELLASSDMMTYEVAEAVGYPDARYFSSVFRKRTGTTPSEYRSGAAGGDAR